MDDVRRYTAPNGLEYKVVDTVFELYSQRRPDRIDELATMGVLEDMFHSDGSLNWDYINSEMPEDAYDELRHMQVFDELEDIEIELVPGAIWDVAYSEGLRHGQISASEVLHRAYHDIWEEVHPKRSFTITACLGVPGAIHGVPARIPTNTAAISSVVFRSCASRA